ncbi:phosphoribosyl-ATP diphosphatase [Enterovirga rhinocerotis]|uniref:Phosphoribosyl-ATP pyrophosphatase n=1 Tax=Enterovirga rhinocerotis TaxID=1339210 RepID=A0A4R7C6Y2_9HYPH|nr:phosphoribosyl-ATP diphosphatase [Enterovirga rhinocerotis]TDR94021.1 phosphoribosyl-ATP pyrophosphatase [Enterovirga rhinocerotis]
MAEAVDRLYAAILDARTRDPQTSKTAKLLREGMTKIAKKVVEEAVEVSLDAVQGDRQRVIEESADLVYNVAVLWAETGVTPTDVWNEIARRERTYGIAEKLPKDTSRKDDR